MKKISGIFESRATVFFATSTLMLTLFILRGNECNNCKKNISEKFSLNTEVLGENKNQKIKFDSSMISEVKAGSLHSQSSFFNPNDKMFDPLMSLAKGSLNTNESGSKSRTWNHSTITDINGDGLNDILYHAYDMNSRYVGSVSGGHDWDEVRDNHTKAYYYKLRVYINNGNGFNKIYHCDYSYCEIGSNDICTKYHGDLKFQVPKYQGHCAK